MLPINPSSPLGRSSEMLQWTAERIAEWIALGRADAEQALRHHPEWLSSSAVLS
jgi:hypothetical protein